jgi:cell division protein FtsI (penicillin-binding protein 3)/stage V sporulation protein D (sporulation-specific penicillin-binding protein)
MEPHSGKILALANFPNFNPNQYTEYAANGDLEIFQNGATQKLFEPGSIFKPITFAIALEEGKITPQTTYIDEGVVKIGGWSIYNYDLKVWGERTMTEVLEKSINTGAVFVGRKIPHSVFLDYLTSFGIFEPTGIDLPETYSENKEFKEGYEINFATAAFGQGIEMTPIQVVRAIGCIANGGKLVKPYLIDPVKNIISNGIENNEIRVISQKTSSQLTAMLVSSVENGYAKRAKIPGYYIAGKTGTSQIPFSNLGINKSGYSDETWQSFIGFAPAFNPKFLILVKLDNPNAKIAGVSTTLVAHDLMKYIIDYYQIPPDYEIE